MSYIDNAAVVRALVRPTEVHKDLFIDNEIFDLEMEHLFANTWVYVGHASQIPNPGDFHTTTVGNQPVVMVRHIDKTVKVLYNRCPHKGVMVAGETSGNTGKERKSGVSGKSVSVSVDCGGRRIIKKK